MGRGLKILLALSLLLNGFLAGVIVMSGKNFFPHHRVMVHGHSDRGAGMFRDTRVLSEEGRKAFHEVFRQGRKDLGPSYQETQRLREELGAALAADPWDRARVEKAFADLRAVETAHQTAFSTKLIDAFEKLSAADRKALVEAAHARREDWRERRQQRRRDRGHGEGDGQGGPPPGLEAPLEGPPPGDPAPDEDAPPPPGE